MAEQLVLTLDFTQQAVNGYSTAFGRLGKAAA
jgi:hypothetical protein